MSWLTRPLLVSLLVIAVFEFSMCRPAEAEVWLPRHLVLIEAPVNSTETFAGATYRFLPSRRLGLGPFVSFEGRVEREVVLQRIRPRFFIQREEARYYGTVGGEMSKLLGRYAGGFVAAGLAYTFGNYGGTRVKPEEGWTPVFRAGLIGRLGTRQTLAHARVGYEYSSLKTDTNNRLYLALGAEFK